MTQVLYAHMNNKTIVKIKNQICPIWMANLSQKDIG
jgi:hypothetical protein